ncbi:iron-containing alcohol dehydrogenase [Motilibacter aurantiacus]|uniref:iron-containing alcohol dehydrogenase n=1 Tax=Motilibacter aurantiacus TaxID=2714955 RepID=UPI00140E1F49|nr:iron-containing alcohol dehydrogenase [Motilibacter aurantiacus]NHC46691.1 iron-containing alcohol dehydrogenase [Motilibacter aurantiacus]
MTVFGLLRSPRHVLFGAGQRRALGTLAASVGRRALVCTDARFSSTPDFDELLGLLRGAGMEVSTFTETLPDVPTGQVVECAELARRAAPDVVLGMGGGSCIDLAKSVTVLLAHGGRPQDYYGEFRVPGPTLPLIALPTTAGTGSEVTPVAVLSDPERSSKVGISSPHIIPWGAVCDPELTYGSPPALTASTGADALAHAVEAFTAIRREPEPGLSAARVFVGKSELTDQYALLAVRLIAANFHRAWSDPDDLEAREAMMLAAMAGGFALGTAGTAAAHAIQYPLGALTHTPHGVGVGALLPYVMEFNRNVREQELARIAREMRVPLQGDDAELADASIEAVADLLASVGIPRTLGELGLAEDKVGWTAEQSLNAARLVENNPRRLDAAGAERIVRAAYAGDRTGLRDEHEPLVAARGGSL